MRQSFLYVLVLLLSALIFGGCGLDTEGDALGDETVRLVEVGSIPITDQGSDDITITVPEGAESMIITADGSGDKIVLANKITSPSGVVVWDWNADITTNRTDPNDSLYTLMIPSSPDVNFESGDWTISLLTDQTTGFNIDVQAIIKTEASSANALDLNLFFVGVEGLDATSGKEDARFQGIVSGVKEIYQGMGVSIGEITYHDITGADADRYSIIDSLSAPDSELANLLRLSSEQTNRAANLFFVAGLNAPNGANLAGRAGSVPGPANLHGTNRSGVVVNMAGYISSAQSGDAAKIETEDNFVKLAFAHEVGHYLGLYHTVEKNGLALDENGIVGQDPISDTPLCADSNDADGNMVLDAAECASDGATNLMFWAPETKTPSTTSLQASQLRKNPLIR